MPQTSFGFSGRFCPVRRPLFQGTFRMIASIEPTAPSPAPADRAGEAIYSERRVAASLLTFGPLMADCRARPSRILRGCARGWSGRPGSYYKLAVTVSNGLTSFAALQEREAPRRRRGG